MLTDEQIDLIAKAFYVSGELIQRGKTVEMDSASCNDVGLLIATIHTLQQQNKQMRETLEWIDEYRELNMTIAMNEWEEAAAFKAVENRVTDTLQPIQGGTDNG